MAHRPSKIDVTIEFPFDAQETVYIPLIQRAIETTIAHAGQGRTWLEAWECSVLLTDDDTIQAYNVTYRGFDKPTDVLSFESHEIDPDTNRLNLGDILISFPTITKQAAKGGHTVTQELELMCVHGALHLMGFDHLEADEKAEMWALQTAVLAQLENPLRPD